MNDVHDVTADDDSGLRAAATDDRLRSVIDHLVDGLPPRKAAAAVDRLIAAYRGRTPTRAPILRDRADVVAYAAYRMPATFAAVASALGEFADRTGDWAPASHVDLGGGTGAATWAVAATWGDTAAPVPRDGIGDHPGGDGGSGDGGSNGDGGGDAHGRAPDHARLRRTTVLDWAGPALDLGRDLAAAADSAALRAATWQHHSFRDTAAPLPEAELVTVSYVLGELEPADRRAVVDRAAAAGRAVVIVEPGTPDGYLRIRAAREALTSAGLRVLAPCPHSGECPIIPGKDWCHFATRVSRSSLHRQVKGGSLAYEDEKFSYVAAVHPDLLGALRGGGDAEAVPDTGTDPGSDAGTGAPAAARIVRRPQQRKGQVLLDLCTRDEGLRRTTVTKRHGSDYRAARNADWGDPWPPL